MAKTPKPKKLTFVYQDTYLNTTNTAEFLTARRTVEEAWDDLHASLMQRAGYSSIDPFNAGRFVKTLVFYGLAKVVDENLPLRQATYAEAKALLNVPRVESLRFAKL